jgi:hypothetical protein
MVVGYRRGRQMVYRRKWHRGCHAGGFQWKFTSRQRSARQAMRNRIAAILLFLSWPVCLIHRNWENRPLTPVSWIIFDKTVSEDFRWVYFANELWLSAFLVLLAWLISTRRTRILRILLWANLWISVVDIFNYWLFFRRSEWLLAAEGMIMVAATVIITKNASKHRNEKTR